MTNKYLFSECSGCKAADGFVFWRIDGANNCFVYCRGCYYGSGPSVPDVYLGKGSGVQYEENIADPKTGQPIPFYDKTSKLAAMKQAGVKEVGDRVHGARNESHLNRKKYFV